MTSAPWNTSDHTVDSLQIEARNFTRVETPDCVNYYLDYTDVTTNAVLVVEDTSAAHNGSSLLSTFTSPSPAVAIEQSPVWMCEAIEANILVTGCRSLINPTEWLVFGVGGFPDGERVKVDYCLLSEPGDNSNRCTLQFSSTIFAIVSTFVILECLFVSWAAWECRDNKGKRLVTFGDAVAAFLEDPDDDTMETATRQPHEPEVTNIYALGKMRWDGTTRPRWFAAATLRAWLISVVL